jgi:hypothetical protein
LPGRAGHVPADGFIRMHILIADHFISFSYHFTDEGTVQSSELLFFLGIFFGILVFFLPASPNHIRLLRSALLTKNPPYSYSQAPISAGTAAHCLPPALGRQGNR